eukprot:s295_g29.t1
MYIPLTLLFLLHHFWLLVTAVFEANGRPCRFWSIATPLGVGFRKLLVVESDLGWISEPPFCGSPLATCRLRNCRGGCQL